jgi:glycosyltransferase involved in cell wall biosynthesis
VFRLAQALKAKGFAPEVVCAHSGWGDSLYIKDAFPSTKLLNYFEWYYYAGGTDADFLPDQPLSDDDRLRIRTKNAPILIDLAQCDRGLCPTAWQRQQFPDLFQSKLTVLHDGIDTDFFRPKAGMRLKLPNLDLAHVEELVTYVARGMEPYRGFPQFMVALANCNAAGRACTASSSATTGSPMVASYPTARPTSRRCWRSLRSTRRARTSPDRCPMDSTCK